MASKLTPEQIATFNDSKEGAVNAGLVVILILTNLSVLSRFAGQLRTQRRLFAEDYLLAVAVICSNVVNALLFVAVHYGLGSHIYKLTATDPRPPENLVNMFKFVWITAVLNGPCFLSIKLSLLFFYRRIFVVNQRWIKVYWWGNLIYAVMWFIGSTLDFIFQCVPVNFYWNRTYLKFPSPPPVSIGECHASANWQVALPIVFSIISDCALLGLPSYTLLRLQMSRKQKIALVAIFTLGALAGFLEVARVIVILAGTDVQGDPSYNTVSFLVLSSAGEGAAIICACLPLIAVQLKHALEKLNIYWHSRSGGAKSFTGTRGQTIGGTGKPIRLGSRRNSTEYLKDAGVMYGMNGTGAYGAGPGGDGAEREETGTRTLIETNDERESVGGDLGRIRVKTDLEWRRL